SARLGADQPTGGGGSTRRSCRVVLGFGGIWAGSARATCRRAGEVPAERSGASARAHALRRARRPGTRGAGVPRRGRRFVARASRCSRGGIGARGDRLRPGRLGRASVRRAGPRAESRSPAAVGAPELEQAGSLLGLCRLLASSGEIERLEPMAQELHELGARHEDRWTVQMALHYLADCPLIGGDYAQSEARYLRALAHAHSSGLL